MSAQRPRHPSLGCRPVQLLACTPATAFVLDGQFGSGRGRAGWVGQGEPGAVNSVVFSAFRLGDR